MTPSPPDPLTPTGESERAPALEAVGIEKRFGSVRALAGVDLTLRAGEVHGLLGENGAGKSTLMNVLYGLVAPDRGEILRDGRRARFRSPRDAIAAGIGMVHQHFTLVPNFTVAENLALGRTRGRFRPRDAADRVRELGRTVGLEVDPDAVVGGLSVGSQQRIEILKALSRDARVLILDEPTGVLAPQEVDDLLALVRRLAEGGAAVVFITHKLAEVERLADRVTVLRRGERVLNGPASRYSIADLARAMIGESAPDAPLAVPGIGIGGIEAPGAAEAPTRDRAGDGPSSGDLAREPRVVLRASGLSVAGDEGGVRVRDAGFAILEGEVLGIAAVEGSGQTELAEAVAGLRPASSGTLQLLSPEGEPCDLKRGRPAAFIDAGGAHIPEDRRRTGLVLAMPIWENLILASHRRAPLRRGGWLDRGRARQAGEAAVREYEIRAPSIDTLASSLSGGNQQKVVIARELMRKPRMLVAVNPTRGLDLRATGYVHSMIQEHRAGGGATLLVSSELDEVMTLSDRVAIMHGGRIVAIVPPTTPREEIGLWMTRGAPERKPAGIEPCGTIEPRTAIDPREATDE